MEIPHWFWWVSRENAFHQIGCGRLSLNGVVIAKMAVTQSTKTIRNSVPPPITEREKNKETTKKKNNFKWKEMKHRKWIQLLCEIAPTPQQTLVNNTHFLPSSPYIFNTFSVRLTTPESKQCFSERANRTNEMKKKLKSNPRNTHSIYTHMMVFNHHVEHSQRSFSIFIIHQAMKANSISALSFHLPEFSSIHFLYIKAKYFLVFFSFCVSILLFVFHFLWLRTFLFSYHKHNGGKMCIRTPDFFRFFSFRIHFDSIFSSHSFYSSFSFPFLSIFIFKFRPYLSLFGGFTVQVVILCALKCIYDDQKLSYRFGRTKNAFLRHNSNFKVRFGRVNTQNQNNEY